MLKDHADLLARLAQLCRIQRKQILAVHDHFSALRTLQQIDAAYQRGFSGAAESDDAEDLPLSDLQGDIPDCMDIAVLRHKCL